MRGNSPSRLLTIPAPSHGLSESLKPSLLLEKTNVPTDGSFQTQEKSATPCFPASDIPAERIPWVSLRNPPTCLRAQLPSLVSGVGAVCQTGLGVQPSRGQ